MPFDATAQTPWAVPFAFGDYLELVDWTGRALREDKPGYIKAREPKILARLGIDGERFSGIFLNSWGWRAYHSRSIWGGVLWCRFLCGMW